MLATNACAENLQVSVDLLVQCRRECAYPCHARCFLFSLTFYMLSFVVDRDHAKVVWWITALVGPVSTAPVSPQSRRPFSKESSNGSVMWVDARSVFCAQVVGPRHFSIAGASQAQQVALCGTTAQIESFLTSGSPRSRNASCMDASIFLLRDIDPAADGHACHGNPLTKLGQLVLNTSLVCHPEFKFSTDSVSPDCAVEVSSTMLLV